MRTRQVRLKASPKQCNNQEKLKNSAIIDHTDVFPSTCLIRWRGWDSRASMPAGRRRKGSRRVPGFPCLLERCGPRHPHTKRCQSRVRETALAGSEA